MCRIGSDDDGAAKTVKAGTKKKSKAGAMKTLEGVYKGIDATGVSLNVDRRKWGVFESNPTPSRRASPCPS